MAAARKNGVPGIVAECGGSLTCASCHVYVNDAWLAKLEPVGPDEDEMLDEVASPRQPNSRLSCQLRIGTELDGLEVDVPAVQQ
jgi:2Fe-2S ferredoxin